MLQQPVLLGGPTTSILLAANFFLLLFGLPEGWRPAARPFGCRASIARGFRVTPWSRLELLDEGVEAGWLPGPGFIVMPSSSLWEFCEARELFEVLMELEVLPATRFWDRVRFRSAKVPEHLMQCVIGVFCIYLRGISDTNGEILTFTRQDT